MFAPDRNEVDMFGVVPAMILAQIRFLCTYKDACSRSMDHIALAIPVETYRILYPGCSTAQFRAVVETLEAKQVILVKSGDDKSGYNILFPREGLLPYSPVKPSPKATRLDEERMKFIRESIAYFNRVTGSSYDPNTELVVKSLTARFKDGHTIEEVKHVVDVKFSEWSNDPDMAKHLNPDVLFGKKFTKYLNQNAPVNAAEQAARFSLGQGNSA